MPAPLLAPLPDALDLRANYTLRVTAVSPTTGNIVSGVKIDTTVITATPMGEGGSGGIDYGDWFLVPGPGA